MFSGYFLISCILYLSGKPRYSRPIVTRDISILEGNSLFGLLPRRYRFSWRDVGYIQGTRQVFSLMFVLGIIPRTPFPDYSWFVGPSFAHSILGVAPVHSWLFIYWFNTSPLFPMVLLSPEDPALLIPFLLEYRLHDVFPCPDFSLIFGIWTKWSIPPDPFLPFSEYGLYEVFLHVCYLCPIHWERYIPTPGNAWGVPALTALHHCGSAVVWPGQTPGIM